MVRMVLTTLAFLGLLGWLPWFAIRPLRTRVNGWLAAPFLGLAVLETFSWYWLEYGTGGMRSGLVVLGALWLAGATLAVVGARSRGERVVPRVTGDGAAAAAVLIGATIILSSLTMVGGLRGAEPAPTTFGNADMAQYAISGDVYVDQGFDAVGWVPGVELGPLGRTDNTGVRPFLSTVALIDGTSVWHATTPAMAVFVVLTAIGATWLAIAATGARPMIATLLGLAALLPFSFVYIVGHQFLAQVPAMAGALALTAVVLENRPRSWREIGGTILPASFMLIPIVLTYPHMALASLVVVGAIGVLLELDAIGRIAVTDVVGSMIRTSAALAGSLLAAVLVLAPAVPGLVAYVGLVSRELFGWPLPLMSPIQALGVAGFGPMTAIGRASMIGPSGGGLSTGTQWWIGAMIVLVCATAASSVGISRRVRLPLFPIATAVVVLASYGIVYCIAGDSYVQWKWITFFQPFLSIAVLVGAMIVIDTAFERRPDRRGVVAAIALVTSLALLGLTLRPVLRLWSRPWWYVSDQLADIGRVAGSGLDRVNVILDDYGETMWAIYFLDPVVTSPRSTSYFPSSGSMRGWTVTKDPYVVGTPLREVPLNSVYRLVCFAEPCTPEPDLPPRD